MPRYPAESKPVTTSYFLDSLATARSIGVHTAKSFSERPARAPQKAKKTLTVVWPPLKKPSRKTKRSPSILTSTGASFVDHKKIQGLGIFRPGDVTDTTQDLSSEESLDPTRLSVRRPPGVPLWCSGRMLLALLLLLGVMLHTMQRNVMGVSLICILKGVEQNGTNMTCRWEYSRSIGYQSDEQYAWSKSEQGLVLAGPSIGYIAATLVAGYFSDRYSASAQLIGSTFAQTFCNFLIPAVAIGGPEWVIIIRVLLGIASAWMWPCVNAIFGFWIPGREKPLFYAIISSGIELGLVVTPAYSIFLCQRTNFLGGWPAIFYTTGLLLALWAFVAWSLVKERPDKTHIISLAEYRYVTQKTGRYSTTESLRKRPLPVKKILISPEVWSVVLCATTTRWGMTILTTYWPIYLYEVLEIPLEHVGDYSALPFIAQMLTRILVSIFSYWLMSQHYFYNKGNGVAKMFNTIGTVGFGACMYGTVYLTCKQANMAVALMCVSAGLYSAVTPGFLTSMVVNAPRYSGFVSSLVDMIAAIVSGIVLTNIVPFIVRNNKDQNQWQIIFGIGSAGMFLSAIVYLKFGKVTELGWAATTVRSSAKLMKKKRRQQFLELKSKHYRK